MNHRSARSVLALLASVFVIAACRDDEPPITGISTGAADLTTDITSNRTLHAETTYTIKGFVHVANGATLTIEPGTRIEGDFATLGSSLFVLRGARIVAQGTALNPIVFTSSRPAGSRAPGDWGGLVLVGNGIINKTSSSGIELEGTGTATGSTPGTNYSVTYHGGSLNTDNSGALSYVRVEFAGYAPAIDEELNSFTFAAVGSGTKLQYLQAMAGLDDAYEFFGGAVDGTYLVSYETGDDHFDMSEGYVGRLQHLIALQSTQLTPRSGAGTPSSDPQGIENDNCDGSACPSGQNSTPLNIPLVANFTLVGTGSTASAGSSGGVGMMLRRGTGGYYVNGVLARWPRAAISLRDANTYARAGSTTTPDLTTTDLAVRNVVAIESPTFFQAQSGSTVQNSFDMAANALTHNTAASTASFFSAFPANISAATTEVAFDWAPTSGSAAASGGMASFTGKIATKAAGASATGHTYSGTAYMGAAAPGGSKWWQGWTKYYQN